MENRKGILPLGRRPDFRATFAIFHFAVSVLLSSILIGGCAAPADPYERKALIPSSVTDLVAVQSGNDVVLTFTLPKETVDHRPLNPSPAIDIYRDFEASSTAAGLRSAVPTNPTLLVTIPAAMQDRYSDHGHVRYVDSLRADDFNQHPDSVAVYMVRTSVSTKKSSGDSSVASVALRRVADPIDDLKGQVTHSAVVLTWTAPQTSLDGPVPPISGYRIYRAEADSASAAGSDPKLKSPLANIGEVETTSFQDEQIEFDETYVYSVRSITKYAGVTLESAESKLAVVTTKDTFPPAAPEGLVVVLVPAQGDARARLELSWAISPEIDIAGYNVYRSDQVGTSGARANTELLLTPAFRDMNVQPGRRYFYSVTAVDRSGNESSSGAVISGDVPAEGQSTP